MKKHTVTTWGKNAPDAYVSNGVIGFRFPKNPFVNVLGLMAGFTTLPCSSMSMPTGFSETQQAQ